MKEICNTMISKHSSLKRAAGIVMVVSKGSVSANVAITGSTAVISLLNKTGQILAEGDHVWINYWQSINDGYIAMKCGDGEYGLGSSSSSTISIDNAFLLRENNHGYITTHSYEVTDDYGTDKFYIPAQGAVGAVSRVDQFDDGFYLYAAPLQLSSGQIVVHYDFGSSHRKGNNFYMYKSLDIQSYTVALDGYHLEAKHMYFADNEVSAGMYIPELVVSASEHQEERHYPLMATPGSEPTSFDETYRIVLYLGLIGYRPHFSNDSLIAENAIWIFKRHLPEVYNPYDYWYEHMYIDYDLRTPIVSTFVDTNTHKGTVTDTKERRVST